jgi:hypothetical protein
MTALLGRRELAYGDIIHDLFDPLHVVLDRVVTLPQKVVFQIQEAEARIELVNELRYAARYSEVAVNNAVDAKARLRAR